jgi:hypothetical protein
MPINPAETPESETPIKPGISAVVSREKLDRRISVAPMMDWTDKVNLTNKIINLGEAKMACLLYVASPFTSRDAVRAAFARGAGDE